MTIATTEANTTEVQNDVRESVWRRHENNERLGIDDAKALWDWLEAREFEDLATWPLSAGDNLFFRGQSDISYGLTSSLYRQVRAAKRTGAITEKDLREAETALIKAVRDEGLGRNLSDFELVTVLQHHLMPTRLIDVSRSPWESLFFAVENNHSVDGILFLINPFGAKALDFEGKGLPWAHFRTGKVNGDSRWTNHVALMQHDALDPRMRAQDGTFLAGGLFRSYPGLVFVTADDVVPADLRSDVSNLALKFLINRPTQLGKEWGGAGWVIRIPGDWKRGLLRRLKAERDISSDTIYPAFTETARLARHIVMQASAAHA
ncbi:MULTISPECIES: FRG domain-containing protein [unclassified Frondihabitans]|uniref:FRG domain-containing protein n=1 Tax=unclassified Frondihabitans TaxID=2626248 RepID=UPI000F50B861|nr:MULTISPECIES: FRG domain-containing protein [unclassified Frondihabitans]RPE77797.1 FRG domain-containing protein [Frondihabitans sp. PhB153]RPF08076.1 FRG domain-containing protein [Frondihabitans sp. PhB161]